MKINIIGGGPAGLYLALLLKKYDSSHEITIFERNAPDDTFGWGVVFSGKTLSNLRDADRETHRQIAESFKKWDNVDVIYRDEKITIRGNHFSGIARIKLLNILQSRCVELGVEIRYRTNAVDTDALRDSDLLVGADGVNSEVRRRYAEHFLPELSEGRNKYIWYGTRQLFHGLTLTFRRSDAGIFSAHSYKFSQTHSTFIVECDGDTWSRAGFSEMSDEESRRYLERVFSKDLGAHELLSNNSRWINFLLVRNRRWRFANVVLLGDALHTAHFSIGSGTKLALEDAIALFECLKECDDVRTALDQFQRERKPIIEEYQKAADESRLWFENVRDYIDLRPLDFAYSLMTRSGKVDLESISQRDPEFAAAYLATRA
jgi:anthraniloyl-CoA monooxygenase